MTLRYSPVSISAAVLACYGCVTGRAASALNAALPPLSTGCRGGDGGAARSAGVLSIIKLSSLTPARSSSGDRYLPDSAWELDVDAALERSCPSASPTFDKNRVNDRSWDIVGLHTKKMPSLRKLHAPRMFGERPNLLQSEGQDQALTGDSKNDRNRCQGHRKEQDGRSAQHTPQSSVLDQPTTAAGSSQKYNSSAKAHHQERMVRVMHIVERGAR